MFTIDIRKNGKWKNVTIENFLFGSLDLGLLTDAECKELAQDFRNAADKLDGGNDAN